jgi:hypothetical protein
VDRESNPYKTKRLDQQANFCASHLKGHPGLSQTALWVRLQQGRVSDRVLVKRVDDSTGTNCMDARHWEGDERDADDRQPAEVAFQ